MKLPYFLICLLLSAGQLHATLAVQGPPIYLGTNGGSSPGSYGGCSYIGYSTNGGAARAPSVGDDIPYGGVIYSDMYGYYTPAGGGSSWFSSCNTANTQRDSAWGANIDWIPVYSETTNYDEYDSSGNPEVVTNYVGSSNAGTYSNPVEAMPAVGVITSVSGGLLAYSNILVCTNNAPILVGVSGVTGYYYGCNPSSSYAIIPGTWGSYVDFGDLTNNQTASPPPRGELSLLGVDSSKDQTVSFHWEVE